MIQGAEGHDHLFLGNEARSRGNGCLPGHVSRPAQGVENPGKQPSNVSQQGQVTVLHRPEAAASEAVALEEPQHDGAEQDDCSGPPDKVHATVPGGAQDISCRGQMVGRQFHDEGSGFAREGFELFQNHSGDGHGGNADEEGGYRHQRGIAKYRPGKQADNGHFRAAGDEARGHDGDFSVIFLLNGAGSQDPRHAAARCHQHGDDGFAGQAEFAQEPVHDEGHPGHIAHIFQDGQEQRKHQNLRHKAQHRAHTC